MSDENNNPVYERTTDKLQPVLINVLIRSILYTKVSQSNLATRFRGAVGFLIIRLLLEKVDK